MACRIHLRHSPRDLSSTLFSATPVQALKVCPCKNASDFSNFRRWKLRWQRSKAVGLRRCVCNLQMSSPDFYEVERLLGTYGFMNITSYSVQSSGGFSLGGIVRNSREGLSESIGKLGTQAINEGDVQIRLYSGRISRGRFRGTRVLFKVYPGRRVGGHIADVLAANELATHLFLQCSFFPHQQLKQLTKLLSLSSNATDMGNATTCRNIQVLIGGFETSTGEQWLVFQDNGRITTDSYAKVASEAMSRGTPVGGWEIWDFPEQRKIIKRRQSFIIKILQGVFAGLSYMHYNNRLHQSLGPASVVLNTSQERSWNYIQTRLCDLAFSVDISKYPCSSLVEDHYSMNSSATQLDVGIAALSEGLWHRAASAGASTPLEKRAFGIADDIFAGGLLLAYMSFIPLCKAGSIDGPSLQRLLESTFQLDILAAREYCDADDRWAEAVKFLDDNDKAGWELLQAMLNPDYRRRPPAEAVLKHRFMNQRSL